MAQLTFTARYKSDQRFNDAVQKIHLEAVLESAGISPEALNKAWESGLRPLSMTQYRKFVADQKKKSPTPDKKKRAAAKKSDKESMSEIAKQMSPRATSQTITTD